MHGGKHTYKQTRHMKNVKEMSSYLLELIKTITEATQTAENVKDLLIDYELPTLIKHFIERYSKNLLPILRAIHDDKFGENIRDKLKNRYVAIFLQLQEAGAKAVMVLLEYHEEEKEEEDEVEVNMSEIKEDMKEVEKLHKNVMKGKKTKKASSKKALPPRNTIKKKKVTRAKVEADDTLLDALGAQ